MASSSRTIVGCMTGTSIDAIDAVLVKVRGKGLSMRATLVRRASLPLAELAAPLRKLAEQTPMTAGEAASIALALGERHAEVIEQLLAGKKPALVVVHGQTVFHQPPVSWQLLNPWPIAARTNAPVLFDLRQADLSAGGQGAPITPLADWVLFRGAAPRALVNLGGFCNITLLPASSGTEPEAESIEGVRGFDVCACNHVLDAVARRVLGSAYDEDGRAAARGAPAPDAASDLDARLRAQHGKGRSLGTGDESAAWIDAWQPRLSAEDLAASAVHGVASAIAGAIPYETEVVCAGGGVKNRTLLAAIRGRVRAACTTSDELGVPSADREAVCMAVLGALCRDRVPITLRQVTGRRATTMISGTWVLP